MKNIIPYKKEISFGAKIAEITSMSLEHEMAIEKGEITGNFIISGDYKSHEISINREPFLFKLPFSIELTERIDQDSVELEITNFSYDILNDDTIEVDIEFSLDALELPMDEKEEEKEVETVKEEEKIEEDLIEIIEEIDDERNVLGEMDEALAISDFNNFVEPVNDPIIEPVENDLVQIETKKELHEDMKESEETIIKNVNLADDSYATYHIHIVKEGESVETICTMYNSNLNLLSDYNDMSNLTIGDKVIIPKEDE